MNLRKLFAEHLSSWIMEMGPEGDVVLSSRVRLARNLKGYKFPSIASQEELAKVLSAVEKFITKSERELKLLRLGGLDALSRQELVEKYLISPEHAKDSPSKGVALDAKGEISVMVNEEDHLRLQVIKPGLAIEDAYKIANKVDDEFESALDYAFSSQFGYLTACPTNVGTGMRASVMLHLPGIVSLGQIERVATACSKLGLVVRGLYGEGTASKGNIFQISNQLSLGFSEQEILSHLHSVSQQIIEEERKSRQRLYEENKIEFEDQIYRAYGVLMYARRMDSSEALELLSRLKLGIDLGVVKDLEPVILKELVVAIRPAILQKIVGLTLEPGERDQKRAEIIRERLSQSN
ncbi:MAG: protein arginine kinase [Firmicutes bacterium]|nr:protein arginine kinase [Bacillota bacterium]